MNNKKLIGVGLLSVLGLIGVVLLVYAAVINCPVGRMFGRDGHPQLQRYH
jgi:nitric oxide reductase large subunit